MSKIKIDRNYLKLGMIIVCVIVGTLLFAVIYTNMSKHRLNSEYLAKHVSTINYNELQNALIELSGDTILYISFTGQKNTYDLDKGIRKIINNQELKDNVIYINMTDRMSKADYIKNLNELLGIENRPITTLPALVYFKDADLIDVIDSKDSILTVGEFSRLIEMYEIGSRPESGRTLYD